MGGKIICKGLSSTFSRVLLLHQGHFLLFFYTSTFSSLNWQDASKNDRANLLFTGTFFGFSFFFTGTFYFTRTISIFCTRGILICTGKKRNIIDTYGCDFLFPMLSALYVISIALEIFNTPHIPPPHLPHPCIPMILFIANTQLKKEDKRKVNLTLDKRKCDHRL